jgi:hypothetical protein
MNSNYPTAIEGTMNLAKTSFSRESFAGAIISVVQCLAPPPQSALIVVIERGCGNNGNRH